MDLDERDMVEAVSDLLKQGFNHEYRIRDGQLYGLTADKPVAASDLRVDGAMRFESAPDAGGVKHPRGRRPEGRQQGPVDRHLRCVGPGVLARTL